MERQKASTPRDSGFLLTSGKVQNASKRAVNLWIGRDASSVLNSVTNSKPKAVSELSYARTIMGNGQRLDLKEDDHHMFCNACNHVRTFLFS